MANQAETSVELKRLCDEKLNKLNDLQISLVGAIARKWCDENKVGAIDSKLLNYCFQVPFEGLPIMKRHECIDFIYPLPIKQVGTFSTNRERVIFLYRDGRTYISRNKMTTQRIVPQLIRAGFRHDEQLFVPLSSGEKVIQNRSMFDSWRWNDLQESSGMMEKPE